IYFRIGREAVLRRMGWKEFGAQEVTVVTSAVKDNLAAILAARKEPG
ncbi:CerR family C-terminal domain-containing protein, partial [Rhizobiaceae sp. 2RAB30]